MISTILLCLLCAAGGFGLGRVKNVTTLAKIKAEVEAVGMTASADALKLVTTIKSYL
jgi:UPF0716 family protein affecting phage T7 exclusion